VRRLNRKKLIYAALAIGAAIAGVALLWRLTPLAEILGPSQIAQRLDSFATHEWTPLILIGAYIVGGLIVFPVTMLSAVVAFVLPPHKAILVSSTGFMLSAILLYFIGKKVLRGRLRTALGPACKRVEKAMANGGIVTIATVRMMPIMPFTLMNIAAGAIGVRFRDYVLGTLIGLAPGVTAVSLFGHQVRAFTRDPSVRGVILVVVIAVAWLCMALALQRWAVRRHQRTNSSTAAEQARAA
jgi:phospholipase D1/2